MKNRLFGILVVAVIGALLWSVRDTFDANDAQKAEGRANPKTQSGKTSVELPARAVLDIRPGVRGSADAIQRENSPLLKSTPITPIALLYQESRDYAAVLAAAEQAPNDAEAQRIKAQTLELCGQVTGSLVDTILNLPQNEEENKKHEEAFNKIEAKRNQEKGKRDPRAEFIATLDAAHPDTPARIAAYDRVRAHRQSMVSLKANPCDSIRNVKVSKRELQSLWDRSERLGDGYASARNFYCGFEPQDMFDSRQKTVDQIAESIEEGTRRSKMDDERLAKLKAALAERDPLKTEVLIGLLGKQFSNGHLYIESPSVSSNRARLGARLLDLLKCDLKGNCAAQTAPELDDACANRGHCAAANIEDYLRFYALPPLRAQDLEQQRQQFREMILSGDFSALKLAKVPRNRDEDEEYFASFNWKDYANTIKCGI